MKKLLLITFLSFFSITVAQEISREEKDLLAKDIFDSMSEEDRKKAFIEIIGLDDFAIDKATDDHPNPNDFMDRIDKQRFLEEYWRKKWYAKQNWWKRAKKNESVGYYVRSKISSYGVKKDWDRTIYKKNGKILKPPKF